MSDDSFRADVLDSELPVVVDFWAEWCAPCRQLAPLLEAAADERAHALRLVKINIEEHPDVAAKYRVMSLPTLILFKNGEPLGAPFVGASSKRALDAWIEQTLET